VRRIISVWMILPAALVAAVTAQAPSSYAIADPRFEVASVKPSRPGAMGGGFDGTPGRFAAENLPLSEVIFYAYETNRFRVETPNWTNKEGFDITATGAMAGQIRLMVRTLLRDRFGLRAHVETRRLPVYVLTVARSDGTLGPNLRKVQMDCSRREPLSDGMMPCSTRNQPRGTLVARATNWQTAILHREMAAAMDRLVLDRTGLKGQFDMRLEWAEPTAAAEPQPDRPSFVTALREQLGLRLERATEPVSVLVVDRIERPSPD
jgi:uncharacterized protein (TIGR03435 family)